MHEKIEKKHKKYIKTHFPNTILNKQQKNLIKHWFKFFYISEKYNIFATADKITPEMITTYNWENDYPTNEFLILLAQEKI